MQAEKLLLQERLKKYPWFREAILRVSLLPGFQEAASYLEVSGAETIEAVFEER